MTAFQLLEHLEVFGPVFFVAGFVTGVVLTFGISTVIGLKRQYLPEN